MASPGQTPQNILAVFKEEYEQGCQIDYNEATPALAVLSRSGTDMLTQAREHFFAIKTQRGQSFRTYGDEDPFQFDTCAAPPDYERVCLKYKASFTPYTFTNKLMYEGTPAGAMFDVIAQDLDDMQEQNASNQERQFLTGDGRNIFFLLDGTEDASDPAAVRYGVKWYGGRENEALGLTMEALTICGMSFQFASECGVAPRATSNTDNDDTLMVIGVVSDYGAEQIIVDGTITGFADGDIVYAARRDNSGIQGCEDGLTGLPLLMDDFTETDEFQCLTEDECGTFKAYIIGDEATQVDLSETILSKATSVIRVRQPRSRMGKANFAKHVFWSHPFQTRKFADTLTATRQLTAPSLWSEKGIKPKFGVEIDALAFDGIPFIESQLAFRNTLFLGDVSQIIQVHNGPAEGQMMKTPDGNTWVNIACSPRFQCAWFTYNNYGARSRKAAVQIKGLTSWDDV